MPKPLLSGSAPPIAFQPSWTLHLPAAGMSAGGGALPVLNRPAPIVPSAEIAVAEENACAPVPRPWNEPADPAKAMACALRSARAAAMNLLPDMVPEIVPPAGRLPLNIRARVDRVLFRQFVEQRLVLV